MCAGFARSIKSFLMFYVNKSASSATLPNAGNHGTSGVRPILGTVDFMV